MYYTQIDSERTVFAVTQTAAPIDRPDMIAVSSMDGSIIGKRHDASSGLFVDRPAPPEARRISVGAFFDRFGAQKWAILSDTSPSVQAVIQDASVRRYIDLDNAQLPGGLQVIASAGHAIDANAILSAPVQASERA